MTARRAHTWSRLAVIETCRRRGAYEYLKSDGGSAQSRGIDSGALLVGIVCHEVIEDYLLKIQQGSAPTRDLLEQILYENSTLHSTINDKAVPVDQVESNCRRLLFRWQHMWLSRMIGLSVVDVEKDFAIDLDAEREFVGQIDLVARDPDSVLWVLDWKTGRVGSRAEEQVSAYALWVQSHYESPGDLVVGAVVDLQNGIVRKRSRSQEMLAVFRQQLASRLRRVDEILREGDLSPTPCHLCSTCPVLPDCEPGRAHVASER